MTVLDKEYIEHEVFSQIKDYAYFYDLLSYSVVHWPTQGTTVISNLDSDVYTSMKGTLESIKDILQKGRINDSYALLRKYFDSTVINIYTILYIENNFNPLDEYFVAQIENWLKGKDKLPNYKDMSEYLRTSPKLKVITGLLTQGVAYKNVRKRCNDHTHYNSYFNLLLNDSEKYVQNRVRILNEFSVDLKYIFIQHLSYLFYLKDEYMMSSDYIDTLDAGINPPEGLQYSVAFFIQDIFSKVIKANRPDIAEVIKNNTVMELG